MIYDIGIVGMGTAGSFAAYKLAKEHKNLKIIAFDIGRPPQKRRAQIEGFLGCLPNSDGKLYLNDTAKVANLVGSKKANASYNYISKLFENINEFTIIKDKDISASANKKLVKNNFTYELNNYIQIYPKDIHILSRLLSNAYDDGENITYEFDNEIKRISKSKGIFTIENSDNIEFQCKKLIISVGRAGWRFANKIFSDFGIIENNNISKIGIRVEGNSSILKDYNKSNCTILKDNLEIGPLSWGGTVVPEDHYDVAISAFRSNENRWKTDKVSFTLIGNEYYEDKGFEQTDRVAKLTFLLSNDRIVKEKVESLLNGKSKLAVIPEYNFLKKAIEEILTIMPDIKKAYFHVPTIIPFPAKINIGNNLESEIDGMFVVGESAGISGILAACEMGIIAANEICK